MIEYLHTYFRPEYAEAGASLAISGGLAGAQLTHNHERQFHYVLQSLTLWREISHDVSETSPCNVRAIAERDVMHNLQTITILVGPDCMTLHQAFNV